MGLSSSIVPPGRRDIEKSRWPPILQNATLPLLCAYYTAFSELPSAVVSLRQLEQAVGLSGDELQSISKIWGGAKNINVWEFLMSLVLTSKVLSLRTKLAFVFRMSDEDRSDKLEVSETTTMLITCMRGIGAYLRWPSDSQLTLEATQEFVQKSFPVHTSENDFVAWVFKQPVLLSTLKAFTAKRLQAKDDLDFELSTASGAKHAEHNSLIANVRAGAEGTASRRRRVSLIGLPAMLGMSKQFKANRTEATLSGKHQADSNSSSLTSCKLPPIGQPSGATETSRRSVMNGQLGCRKNAPTCLDKSHRCSLHGHAHSECTLLTKHETWLSHLLWQSLQDYKGALDAAGVKRLLRRSAKKMRGDEALECYAGLVRLSNPRGNPFFAVCLGRMRSGTAVPFRDFLQALCPCASPDQISCLEKFDLRNWQEEKQFIEAAEQWSCNSSDFWCKPVMRPKLRKELEEHFEAMDFNGDSRLSVSEICQSGFSPDDAKEFVSRHDLDGNGSLTLNEYVHMGCPDGKRTKADAGLEEALQSHWDSILQSWELGKCADPSTSPTVARKLFNSADSNGDGSITLDELAGYLDVCTSHDLMAAYDINSDGRLSHSEFHSMVGATAVAH